MKNTTFRTHDYVKDLILPYTTFAVPAFQELLWKFKNLIVDPNQTKNSFKYSVTYRGVKTDFGLGGVHGAKRGIYEADENITIMTSDVISYYPNLAIRNKWAPEHLPNKIFTEQYEWFFDERVKIPKKDPSNYIYKIILNSTFGLSNDKNCFLYDSEFTMRITINGQLSLMMLYTMLGERVPGCVPIMTNTDGMEMMIPIKQKDLYLAVCKEWETITSLQLEHEEYQKLVVPDVNNYIGIYKEKEVTGSEWLAFQKESPDNLFKRKAGKFYMAKTKCKGRFEFQDRPLHKNKSYNVICKALYPT
jgi:DNA polymerase elongation subunit (family B)